MRKPPGKEPGYRDWAKQRVCELIASGMTLRQACREENMPTHKTVLDWVQKDPAFANQYARARDLLLEHWAEEIVEIADDGSRDTKVVGEDGREVADTEWINRSRLRVDARKWLLSKLKPGTYGDKLDVEHKGNVTVEIVKFPDAG
jgi:hypothetical protein